MTTSLAICHPKGGVGRSTTTYMLGLELARAFPHRTVGLEDLDQGQHLTRAFQTGLARVELLNLRLEGPELRNDDPDLVLVDTAPEATPHAMLRILGHSDWLLVPVKGPEPGSVQALPMLLRWLDEARATGGGCQLLGFVPTMYKPRRAQTAHWMRELEAIARARGCRMFAPIHDLAGIAAWSDAGHPYARLASEVAHVLGFS